MTILCVQWQNEDELPKMSKEEYNLLFAKSEVRPLPVPPGVLPSDWIPAGVRMFPYVWIMDVNGNDAKAFLS